MWPNPQIRSFMRIWSHLPEKSLMKNFIFCVVKNFVFGNFPPSQRLAPIINKFLKFRIFHSKLISWGSLGLRDHLNLKLKHRKQKWSQWYHKPTKNLKQNLNYFASFLHENITIALKSNFFVWFNLFHLGSFRSYWRILSVYRYILIIIVL